MMQRHTEPTAAEEASWPAPNYINPDTNTTLLLATHIPLVVVTIIVVILRVITRVFITQSFGKDDILIICASVVGTTLMVLNCFAATWGWGYHIWDFKPEWVTPARTLVFAEENLFLVAIALTKCSILCFYLRVFSSKGFKKLVYIGFGYVVCWLVASIIVVMLQCRPIRAYWDYSVKGQCLDSFAAFLCTALFNSISDFYVFFLPMKQIWDIQLPKKQRMGLVAVFSLGLIACVAAFVRIYYIKIIFDSSVDWTWYGAYLYVATAIEVDVGILCASIPALKPLFTRYFPNLLSSASRSMMGNSRAPPETGRSNAFPLSSYDGRQKSNIRSTVSRMDSDNCSEEFIIQNSEKDRHEGPGIQRKVEVRVQYDEESLAGRSELESEADSRRVQKI